MTRPSKPIRIRTNRLSRPLLAIVTAIFVCLAVTFASAEHLPIKIFNSTDGLGSSFIDYLARDSKGFLWICTRDGLSRFDGSQFITYQIGEPGAVSGIESIYEQSNGTYWVGTTNGLYRFNSETLSQANPAKNGRPLLNAEFVGNVRGHMYEDHAGQLWFMSSGLLKVDENDGKVSFNAVDLHLPDDLSKGLNLIDNPQDSDGCFWFSAPRGLLRRLPDGRVIFYEADHESLQNVIIRDRNDLIWAARGKEIFIAKPEPVDSLRDLDTFTLRKLVPSKEFWIHSGDGMSFPEKPGEVYRYISHEFLEKHVIRRLFESSDGHIWIPTEENLVEYDGTSLHLFTPANGFAPSMARVAEDAAGNLWFGGFSGLVRLDRRGFVSYDKSDGLASTNIYSVFEGSDRLFVGTGGLSVAELLPNGFRSAAPQLAPDSVPIWTSQFAFRDREGDWWFATQNGLNRYSNIKDFSQLDHKKPTAIYDLKSGLPNNEAFHIFETNNGDIWFSQFPSRSANRRLVRWTRANEAFHVFTPEEGLPEGRSATAFAEDKFGNLWLGFYEGGIAKYRDGKFTVFNNYPAIQSGIVTDLLIDRSDRMWISSAIGGVMRIDDTSADTPQMQRFTTEDGIISNNVRTIAEDNFGQIYLGTVRGIDRLSVDLLQIKHFTVNDGLASDFVVDSHRDKNGDLWFATTNGLSRITPAHEQTRAVPLTFLGKFVVAGEEQPVPVLGSSAIDKGELSSSQNNLQFDFFGLDFRAGETLRYQYKFESERDWSPPSTLQTVTFAKLSPGSYRFLVRAVNSDGVVSDVPATVTFRILPPLWLRWWFITLSALICFVIVVSFYRYRVANLRRVNAALFEAKSAEENLRRTREEQIKELESVKTRIATDLHDDIGSSLTQIAILSEVARARSAHKNGSSDVLQKITDVSNELVGVMSDIVWSINPEKDRFSDLTQRMRRIASDMLSPKGIFVHFRSRDEDKTVVVKTNVRREVFLIFKESITNIAKHSEAKNIFIDLQISDGLLHLRIEDDGKGFGLAKDSLDDTLASDTLGGNGLRNMRKRASEMNGVFDVESSPGQGTIVRLSLPTEENV